MSNKAAGSESTVLPSGVGVDEIVVVGGDGVHVGMMDSGSGEVLLVVLMFVVAVVRRDSDAFAERGCGRSPASTLLVLELELELVLMLVLLCCWLEWLGLERNIRLKRRWWCLLLLMMMTMMKVVIDMMEVVVCSLLHHQLL